MKFIRAAMLLLALTAFVSQVVQGNPLLGWGILFVSSAAIVPWSDYNPRVFAAPGLLAIPEHYVRTFSSIWDHAVQQEVMLLGDRVTIDNFEGKEKVYTDIDPVEFREKRGRLQKTVAKEITGAKRKMTRQNFTCHYIFDRDDAALLAMLGEPQSELIVEMKMAFNRSVDDGIVDAASGTVYGGVDPYVTPITLPNTQKVAVNFVYSGAAANSGMTVDKLQRAIKLIEDNTLSITTEEFYLAMGPKQKEDLFQFVKSAPNDGYAQMIGEWFKDPSKKLFGFNVIITTRLTLNASTDVRTCLIWSKRGIYAAPSKMETKIDPRPDMEHATQISSYGAFGFMRRREERVIEIFCDESP